MSGSAAARRRSNAAWAEASETCCSSTMCRSVANPGVRSQSGGGPWRATIAGEVRVARREFGDRGQRGPAAVQRRAIRRPTRRA